MIRGYSFRLLWAGRPHSGAPFPPSRPGTVPRRLPTKPFFSGRAAAAASVGFRPQRSGLLCVSFLFYLRRFSVPRGSTNRRRVQAAGFSGACCCRLRGVCSFLFAFWSVCVSPCCRRCSSASPQLCCCYCVVARSYRGVAQALARARARARREQRGIQNVVPPTLHAY